MGFGIVDIVVFVAFVVAVVTVGLVKSGKEKTSEDYFLAGRGLSWWLIGFSLIAANISTEQFVGMSGNAASHAGLAIASYEWIAAITLVVVAFAFLPYFLRAGIYTMPEFLEYRYNAAARTIMALCTLLIYVLLLGAVTYSGALTIKTIAAERGVQVSLSLAALVIGVIAMLYVAAGGLKACAWADLIQGSALILGGAIIMVLAFKVLGRMETAWTFSDIQQGIVEAKRLDPGAGSLSRFLDLNSNRLNMFLPKNDPILPWTALLLGIWIPNFYYWGLNQYITQRTLGSASLSQGQRGIVFAAFLKLLVPFVVVIPGIIAFNLYAEDMRLDARGDVAGGLAKYVKANPGTQCVQIVDSPTQDAISGWRGEGGRYMMALYPDPAALQAVKVSNPFVVRMVRSDFDATQAAEHTVFMSEDKAWRSLNADLAAEIGLYDARTQEAARAAGKPTHTEKLISYKYDTALGYLMSRVLPMNVGLFGFVCAALLGAVVSSLAAMLNAASTIFSMDIYRKFLAPKASQGTIVLLGRICVVVFATIAVMLAPQLGNPNLRNSIFTIIQESQGFISPGVLAVFVFGLLSRRAPALCGVLGLLTSIASYGILMVAAPSVQFLNRMAICFGLCLVVMWVLTTVRPLAKPVEFRRNTDIDLTPSRGARTAGIVVILLTLVLYVIFSPIGVAK